MDYDLESIKQTNDDMHAFGKAFRRVGEVVTISRGDCLNRFVSYGMIEVLHTVSAAVVHACATHRGMRVYRNWLQWNQTTTRLLASNCNLSPYVPPPPASKPFDTTVVPQHEPQSAWRLARLLGA